MTPVTDPAILAKLNINSGLPVTDPELLAKLNGPQPSIIDRALASPAGRFVHDVGANSLSGIANMASKAADLAGPFSLGLAGPLMEQATHTADQPYQGALARNRNTPGYASALADAQKAHSGGSDFTSQMAGAVLPSLAGAVGAPGGFDAMNANADAQQQSQDAYGQKHPLLSAGAGVLGGLLLAPEAPELGAETALAPKQSVPSIADLRASAKQAYKQVDDTGVRVSTDALNSMADSLEDKIGPRLDPVLHPDATAAYKRVMQYGTDNATAANPATFTELDNLRRVVSDASQSIKPADRALAGMIRDHLDDFVNGLSASDLDTSAVDAARANLTSVTGQKGAVAKQISSIEANKPGALAARGAAGADTRATYMDLHDQIPQLEAQRQSALSDFQNENDLVNAGPQDAINSLNSARDYWSRASQAQTIQDVLDKADIKASGYSQSGQENAVRAGFRQLALNDRKMARLSSNVQDAVIAVAKGGPITNTLRNIGRFAPHGPVAAAAGASLGSGAGALLGGLAGAAGGGGVGAALLPLVGEAARAGATSRTLAAAQRALDTAALGRTAIPSSPQPALQLPRLTNQSALPLGLLLQPQQQSMASR